jgi:preprotein translocase subunit SecY
MKFIQTLKNIWSIEDLRSRILTTLGLVLIFRVGTYIVLPGINPSALDDLQQQTTGGILGLVNIFAGGALI